MAPTKGLVDDLTRLNDLNEQALLDELRVRYSKDGIYTYIGDILVSINPFKILPIYGEEIGGQYCKMKLKRDLPPHIYAMSTTSYTNLQRTGVNQSILVTGESGSGKTECTKMLLAQLVRITETHGHSELHEQIRQVNPLLEAFGNAQTALNNNSSRFGKLIQLMLSPSGDLIGAKITEHMLEKTRVVRQCAGEKNFNIFYYLFAGLSPYELKRYYIGRPEMYRIIDPGHGVPVFMNEVEFQSQCEMMCQLREVMVGVGFTTQDLDIICALLSAILHMCNIEFVQEPESAQVIIINEDEVDYASTLLSVQPEDMVSVFLASTAFIRGERLVTLRSVSQACECRDSLAKALYSRLFCWIVQQINVMLQPKFTQYSYGAPQEICILDMPGFENFTVNSFEQLCINAASEQLLSVYNELVFHSELQEYGGEGVKQPKIKLSGNKEVVDLLLQRRVGMFALIEDECKLANTSDNLLAENCQKHFAKNGHYRKPKGGGAVFTIAHFAAPVTYRMDGFIEKNRDHLSSNVYSLMENSHSKLVNELFAAKMSDTGTFDIRKESNREAWSAPEWRTPNRPPYGPGDSMSRQTGRKLKQEASRYGGQTDIHGESPNTTSAYFQNSLSMLIDKLSQGDMQFVRCLKPNNLKSPNDFDTKLIMDQLRSTGVLETAKIRLHGYTTRLPFHVFLDRYRFLAFPLKVRVEPSPKNCIRLMKALEMKTYEIGKTKVFLKYWHVEKLNLRLDRTLFLVVRTQARFRRFLTLRWYRRVQAQRRWQEAQISEISQQVEKEGSKNFHITQTHSDQDRNKFEQMMRERGPQRGSGYGWQRNQTGRLNRVDPEDFPDYDDDDYPVQSRHEDYRSPGIYDSRYSPGITGAEFFYQQAVKNIMDKWDELDPDIWCKIIYMEYDKPIAKFYILDKEVIIDGSFEEFSGKRIGLGVFRNPERDEKSDEIRNYIGKGVALRKGTDGSILARRLGKNPVIVKGYQDPKNHCLSADVIQEEGRLPQDEELKMFDMEEFKCQIGIEMRRETFNQSRLQQLSVTGISLIKDSEDDLDTPCWLCIVSIAALEAIDNQDVRRQVQQKFAELSIRDEEDRQKEKELIEITERNKARKWTKVNQRSSFEGKDAPMRKTRIELRKKGESIEGKMDYSWDEKYYDSKNQKLNVADLEERFDNYEEPESVIGDFGRERRSRYTKAESVASSNMYEGSPVRKDWAKVKIAIKGENMEEGEAFRKGRREDH